MLLSWLESPESLVSVKCAKVEAWVGLRDGRSLRHERLIRCRGRKDARRPGFQWQASKKRQRTEWQCAPKDSSSAPPTVPCGDVHGDSGEPGGTIAGPRLQSQQCPGRPALLGSSPGAPWTLGSSGCCKYKASESRFQWAQCRPSAYFTARKC